jgi:hypothetical protein
MAAVTDPKRTVATKKLFRRHQGCSRDS